MKLKLSVLMPLYNVEETLARAIDSILMQEVDFEYEIILINDASIDNTMQVVDQYRANYDNILLIEHEVNLGNARSFYDGLVQASGEYFCVLDGDDYYSVVDKFQRQVDFLDRDVKLEYAAVTHHFVYDFGDGTINIPDRSEVEEGTLLTWLTGEFGYYHTATYMFRNIFRGKPPEFIGDIINRGDTPRTWLHLLYSGGKIKRLDFFGSVYVFCYEGLWSSMSERQQIDYQLRYNKYRLDVATFDFDRKIAERKISWYTKGASRSSEEQVRMPRLSIDEALDRVREYTKLFAFGAGDFTFQGMYCSLYIDSLCVTLGQIFRVYQPDCVQSSVNNEAIVVVNGVLSPHGGGVFAELVELSKVFSKKQVYLFVTNMDIIDQAAKDALSICENVTIVLPPVDCDSKVEFFSRSLAEIAPYKAIYYASHHDVIAPAIMQKGHSQNSCMFSFDHGFVCGLLNSNLDTVIAKRPVDYQMVSRSVSTRVIYIPAWSDREPKLLSGEYVPFRSNKALVTAGGAARFYKIDGKPPFDYVNMILELLQQTHGKHYHFGAIPAEVKDHVSNYLDKHGLPRDSFVNIDWSECIPRDMIEYGVDVFIEPFPVVSYKMTLEILAWGIPIVTYEGNRRLEITDFIYPGHLSWRNRQDFFSVLTALTPEELSKHSVMSREYFACNHAQSVVAPCLESGTSLCDPAECYATDGVVRDIMDYLLLFGKGDSARPFVSIMNGVSPDRIDSHLDKDKGSSVKGENTDFDEMLSRRLEEEKRKLYESNSYKIGRLVTLPVRKIKKLLRGLNGKV